MQVSIVYGILISLLTCEDKIGLKELSRKFELSERSVIRYIDALSEAGVPVTSSRGRHGGYRIDGSFKLEQSFLTEKEYERAITCLNATRHTFGDRLNEEIADKLTHMSEASRRERDYLLKSDTLIIDSGPWNSPAYYRGRMETINRAITERRSLFMCYAGQSAEQSERIFDPYTLILKQGSWYVYGFCEVRKDFRLFRLSRIKSLRITDFYFEIKPSDVYSKLSGEFEGVEKLNIELSFDESALAEIEEWLGAEAVKKAPGKGYCARARVYGGSPLVKKLMSFGSSVTVESPEYLRAQLKEECESLVREYANVPKV